ncbi:MAG: zinc-ribbon domain-containing protein [Treponematales bacterium]
MFCGSCGTHMNDRAKFCPSCGWTAPDAVVSRTEMPAGNMCAMCGTPFKKGAKFCGGCGAKVETKPQAVVPVLVKTPAAASGEVCAACGKPVEAVWKVCPFCKAAIVRDKLCVKCGKKLEPEWNACPFCGTESVGNGCNMEISGEALEKARTVMSLGYGRAATIEALVKTGLSEQQAEGFYEKETKGA